MRFYQSIIRSKRMSKINGKIELISTVKRNNYIKSSVEK